MGPNLSPATLDSPSPICSKAGGPEPRPSEYPRYFDCGTCGPAGAGAGAAGAGGAAGCPCWPDGCPCWPDGCPCWRSVSSTPRPPPPSGCGAPAGPGWVVGLVPSRIECGLRSQPARIDSTRLVAKNTAASVAVVRVNTLALPRLVMNPPPVLPMPSPPPSERCSRTTPVMASTTMRWITIMTVCIQNPDQSRPAAPRQRAEVPHIGSGGSLHDPPRHFQPAKPPQPFRGKLDLGQANPAAIQRRYGLATASARRLDR